MPSILKLICNILRNPNKPIKQSDAKRILENERAEFKRVTGSHHIYKYKGKLIVFQVHGKELHPEATKDIIEVLELREKYEESCD